MLLCIAITFIFSRINTPWDYDAKHVLFHIMGLSLFFDLLSLPNNAGMGYGLWFVTTILIMYLTLPIQIKLFTHRNGKLHLLMVFLLCLLLKLYLKIDSSPWVVLASFSLGVYLSVRNKVESATSMSFPKASFLLLGITIISYFAVAKGIYWIIPLLTPAYPLVMLPFFKGMCNFLSGTVLKAITFFSLISYEFYMLQFSFINGGLTKLINVNGLVAHIALSFTILIIAAYIVNNISKRMIEKSISYMDK
ncbi:hypothetical protein BHU62_00375 [Serratia marcescens]|uniref:Acyltransferase 3 domain-containing protein n=2 Tax=Serratia marcescens TaxID=615 RepID=A0A1Q4P607_SERMA|nr:hypothetical protein BHU62_00375 [Serratia marcescens]